MTDTIVTVRYDTTDSEKFYKARVINIIREWDQWILLVWDLESECIRVVSHLIVDEWE